VSFEVDDAAVAVLMRVASLWEVFGRGLAFAGACAVEEAVGA
jgi:hypothetical protein